MSNNILGLSFFYHDSAAALVQDGQIVAAAQEERFTRLKGDARFPRSAIAYCLRESGLRPCDVQLAAFYERPAVKFGRLLETYLGFAPQGFQSFRQAIPLWVRQKLHLERNIREGLGPEFHGDICVVGHHQSHAASAFFPSPFEEAAILTLDAVGEWSTASIGLGQGNRITLQQELTFPHSLGMLYSAFTYYAGFKVNSGEYKLMGLAPYGTPHYTDLIREKVIHIYDDGSLWLDMSYFNYCQGLTMTSDKFHKLFGGPPRRPETQLEQRHMDLAASVQAVCEEVVLRAAQHAHATTGMKNLVMAGGVALNCVANGKLMRNGPFERVWIQPAAGDSGGALGAALLAWHQHLDQPRTSQPSDAQRGSLLGPAFADADIGVFLDSMGAVYEQTADEDALLDRVARLLDDDKVVGWFHGRMEYGPRALGSRSILGDARSTRMQQVMNLKIKFRESFRPFAPCVLREFASQVFDLPEDVETPYMLMVAPVRDDWRLPLTAEQRELMRHPDLRVRVNVPRSRVPAVTHVDYSARIQTVDADRHGRFYRLLRRFHEITDCPVIVNTSFNIRGEPIVCSFEDAYRCFVATDMDCLVLENHILLKDEQPRHLLLDSEAYRAQYALD